MFTREEASMIRQEFWTTFGRYMNPVPSSEGYKVNWINYHTRVKDVYFRMNAGQKAASIGIVMQNADPAIRELYFEQFQELKEMLHGMMEEEWVWELHTYDESGKVISRIYKEMNGVSVFNRDQWPQLISFFKPRIIALDAFWENARYSFEALQ